MIAIVDYAVGNLRSVERALMHWGARPRLTADQDDLGRADGIVLPGDGAFAPAMDRLAASGLGRRLVEEARRGRPLLGVCLGYQALFERSHEHGLHAGLGLLPGDIVEVRATARLPVIGWCRVRLEELSPLFAGVEDGSYFYFLHSYTPESGRGALASAEHTPSAAAARVNVMGTQFHPEKSGADGLRLYRNFLELCGAG